MKLGPMVKIDTLKESPFSTGIYGTEASADLIESIQANGVLVPIWITQDNMIIAGHRRINACKALGIEEIEAETKPYSDLLVIESNRYREKTCAEKLREAEALEKIEKPKAEKRQRAGVVADWPQGRTRDKAAAVIGVSSRTLGRLQAIAKAKPSLIAEIDAGKKSVDGAYRLVKRDQNLRDFHKKKTPLPEGRFNIVYADPPWQYEYSIAGNRDIENQYPTMDVDAICALPVPEITADGAVLFLWATSPKIEEALKVIRAWGFRYRTNMVWVKDKIGMGYYCRQQHELLLIARHGEFSPPEESNRPSSIIEAPRLAHSHKPDMVYEIIERMYPSGQYVELFARQQREGWMAWGLEA